MRAAVLAATGSLFCASLTAPSGSVTVGPGPDSEAFRYGGPESRVIARGLDNPRGLTFGPRGELYVAEAGRGGDASCRRGADGGRICDGPSGAVTVIDFGHQWRVVSRLPSTAAPDGTSASGTADVAVGGDGDLVHAGTSGLHRGRTTIAGTGTEGLVAVLVVERGYLVVDAGANALLRVTARGRVQTVATFARRDVSFPGGIPDGPPRGVPFPMEALPSSVAEGPDGAWYVGERTGFPSPPGEARIWRVVPGRAPEVWATGLTRIADLAWSPEGRLYVLESGALLRVDAGGTREVVLSEGLTEAAGLAIRGGDAYISNCGTCRGTGTVLRVPL